MHGRAPDVEAPDRGAPSRDASDVRALVGRRIESTGDRSQGLLEEIRRLRHDAALARNREAVKRLLLVLALLTAHGPRNDRLLRYQLEEMGEHLRRLAGVGLAA